MKKKQKEITSSKDALKSRFGTDGNFVDINLPLTATELDTYFGPECEEYDCHCLVCRAWSDWITTNKATIVLERDELIKIMSKHPISTGCKLHLEKELALKKKEKKDKKKNRQALQLESLKNRFGTDGEKVSVTLPLTASELESYFGPQCEEFCPTCVCCKTWSEWHFTGKATVTFARSEIVRLMK